jgi:hypothetical protein
VTAVEWTDALGANLLVVSESIELRHEPGVRWSPTEFVTHTASHYVGKVALALGARAVSRTLCSNPARSHLARPPVLSDVDRDGIAEVVGALDVRCGDEASAHPWAFEGGVDLFHRPPEGKYGCGGDGELSTSVRATPFEAHMRERWLRSSGQVSDETVVPSAWISQARASFAAAPVPRADVPGAIEDGLRWTDKTGDSAIVFSRTTDQANGSIRLFATLLRKGSSEWSILQRLSEGSTGCPEDNATRFQPHVLDLTDLDRDGIREVTFAYQHGCVSDVSPVNAELVVIEDQALHLTRGRTWVGQDDHDGICTPPGPLVFDDDPIKKLIEKLDPRG